MIEFRDGDEVIGRVVYRDGSLIALDPLVRSYVDGWINRRRAPQDFETYYDGWANGYANARRVDDDLTAAAEVHTGAMIALVPTEEDAERLAIDGGEDPDQLHVTLVYLGEAALIPAEVREAIIDSVSRWASDLATTVVGDAFAVSMFNPSTSSLTAAFDPNQSRDARGRWTRTPGTGDDDAGSGFDPQQLAIHYYTGAGFRKLNEALRSGGDLSNVPSRPVFLRRDGKFVDVEVSPKDAVTNLDNAIAASPLKTSKTLYRGTSTTPPSVGSVIVDDGYMSTSRSEKGAGYFLRGDGALWEIHAPAGTHALDINEGPNTHEQETVLPRGSSLRVRELIRDENDRVTRVIADLLENSDQVTAGAGGSEPCVVLGIGGDQLDNLHEVILNTVNGEMNRAGMSLHPQHRPWVAHLTLLYTDDADLSYFTDRVGPVTFDRLRLAFGGDVYDIPFGDAASDDNTMMEPGAPEESETL